jgi:hypothetical protein
LSSTLKFFNIKRLSPGEDLSGFGVKGGEAHVMHEQLESHARYLAYRWWRLKDLGASHSQGWEFALGNWANFLFEARRHFNLEEEELVLLGGHFAV